MKKEISRTEAIERYIDHRGYYILPQLNQVKKLMTLLDASLCLVPFITGMCIYIYAHAGTQKDSSQRSRHLGVHRCSPEPTNLLGGLRIAAIAREDIAQILKNFGAIAAIHTLPTGLEGCNCNSRRRSTKNQKGEDYVTRRV